VIKADIVERIASEAGIPKIKAEHAADRILEAMKSALARGDRIELRGFGVFEAKVRKPGIGRNPRTGEVVAIGPTRSARFKPGKDLAELPTED